MNFGLPPESVRVIYNPIDCRQARSDSEQEVTEPVFQSGSPVILNVGRLAPQKNQALLIRAFARTRRDVAAKLAFLGQGPLELELRALSERLGVEKDVHFLGWRSNPFKYMRRAQVFALSSDYEGFGNVLVEAMACGCPVISTDCPYGPGEIIENNKDGLLVPVGDGAALTEAIARMLQDRSLREQVGAAGMERAGDFDLPVIANQVQKPSEQLVPGKTMTISHTLKQFIKAIPFFYPLRTFLLKARDKKAVREWENNERHGPPPHSIKQKALLEYARLYNLRIFVETGTLYGDMGQAMKHHFDLLYSIELNPVLFAIAKARFR